MRVSVVVTHFFAERLPNLPLIAAALQSGTLRPVEIIVWNNDRPFDVPFDVSFDLAISGVRAVQSPGNLGCKARFLAADEAVGDYILFHDNDLSVQPRTLEHLITHAGEDVITSLEGRRLIAGRPYRDSIPIHGSIVRGVVDVDVSLGRLELVHRQLVRDIVAGVAFEDIDEMDDIWFSAAAARRGISRCVVPCGPDEGFNELPDGGVGSSVTDRERHFRKRDASCARLFVADNAGNERRAC